MKVNDTKQTAAVSAATESPPPVPAAASSAPTADRVTTDEADHLKESVTSSRRMAAGERALRLQSLAQQVRSGAYRPNVSRLAAEILDQAELDARLARTLH